MQLHEIFFNSVGRLRSGWRVSIYVLLVVVLSIVAGALLKFAGPLQRVLAFVALLFVSILAGWGCGSLLEGLPWGAVGWSFHKGSMRDLFVGSLIGSASLLLAAAVAALVGGLRFSFSGTGAFPAVGKTMLLSGALFAIAAAAEEALFRGYVLQTFTRARLWWVGILLTSVPFALVHLDNPNVAAGFTFLNTALAGGWLAAAYLRTRSLWFPLGIHWAWNWTMAAAVGLPVSGFTDLAPSPLFRTIDLGPSWLTGGSYGIEGGAACTVVLVLSTLFIWRTKLISATDEMIALSSHEMSTGATELSLDYKTSRTLD